MLNIKKSKFTKKFIDIIKSKTFLFGLIYVFCFFFIYRTTIDPDFGWHLKSGQYYLEHWMPSHDVFTYTAADFPWINHEWLSDILLAILHFIGGFTLLAAVYAGLWTLALWLVGAEAGALTVIVAVVALIPFMGVRTITLSLLGLAILHRLYSKNQNQKLWLLPIIFIIWANMHGSFVMGLAYLAFLAVKNRSWRMAAYVLVGAAVTLLNPYGFDIYVEVLRTITDSSLRLNINEWQPCSIPLLTWPFIILWLAAFVMKDANNWRNYINFDLFLFILGISSQRNIVLFVILAVAITGKRLKQVTLPKNLKIRQKILAAVCGTIVAISFIGLIFYEFSTNMWIPPNREYFYPQKIVEYLKKNPCEGNIFSAYNYGGYLIWKLPEKKVYIDGRMPSWRLDGANYLQNYNDVVTNYFFLKKEFAKYNVKCAILDNYDDTKMTILMLIFTKWSIVSQDNGMYLLKYAGD